MFEYEYQHIREENLDKLKHTFELFYQQNMESCKHPNKYYLMDLNIDIKSNWIHKFDQ